MMPFRPTSSFMAVKREQITLGEADTHPGIRLLHGKRNIKKTTLFWLSMEFSIALHILLSFL
jgi:hypothetical protein